ncbi:hypothetical protein [Polymorphospora sp. NPDC050346]|uniref:hypothetical protein n=1 Tax=Polymorphospora sp. NPDC050346 TaxID=3155780 RepID=UPI0033F951BE
MSDGKWSQLSNSFEFVHKNLDGFKIKEKVDSMGIDGYINYCALLAAGSGAVAGVGGPITFVVGVPADVANTVAQQFRVTLAVIYHRTGRYAVSFPEFMKIVGLSLGVEVGVMGLQQVVRVVAQVILKKLTARVAGKVIPFVGAAVGGGLNYAFIKAIGGTLLAFEDSIFNGRRELPPG